MGSASLVALRNSLRMSKKVYSISSRNLQTLKRLIFIQLQLRDIKRSVKEQTMKTNCIQQGWSKKQGM